VNVKGHPETMLFRFTGLVSTVRKAS
jgi:hypothetical protein